MKNLSMEKISFFLCFIFALWIMQRYRSVQQSYVVKPELKLTERKHGWLKVSSEFTGKDRESFNLTLINSNVKVELTSWLEIVMFIVAIYSVQQAKFTKLRYMFSSTVLTMTELFMSFLGHRDICYLMKAGRIFPEQKRFKLLDILGVKHSLTVFPFTLNQMAEDILFIQASAENLMKYEWARLESFKTFPVDCNMWPLRLAQAGFYYTGRGTEVKCFCCGMTNGDWTTGETAMKVHKRLSPTCSFICGENNSNEPIHPPAYYADIFENVRNNENAREGRILSNSLEHSVSSNIPSCSRNIISDILQESIGRRDSNSDANIPVETLPASSQLTTGTVPTVNGIKYPKYTDISRRIASFENWKLHHIQSPHELAEAGFFYVGIKDYVRCFSCGVGLENWAKNEKPLEEHFRWSPTCQFVKYKQRESEKQGSQSNQNIRNTTSCCDGDKEKIIEELRTENKVLKKQNQSLKEKQQHQEESLRCKVCLNSEANVVFLPCGHLASCQNCAQQLEKCAVCREIIKGTIRVYQC